MRSPLVQDLGGFSFWPAIIVLTPCLIRIRFIIISGYCYANSPYSPVMPSTGMYFLNKFCIAKYLA